MINLTNITKRFGQYPALHGIDLAIQPGEFIALLGPSGSGKTTLLRIIAGLEFQDSGEVRLDGVDVSTLKVADRSVGFVFQHYALFRHMSVADNVAFGLTVRRHKRQAKSLKSRRDIRARADELLRLVQLDGMGRRYPAQLSGGQRQRVALARALAVEPKLLLLDEPFGALDAQVRKDLRRALRDLHQQMGLTSVFVTHDQEEALELADRVVVMNAGKIEQIGTPEEIYAAPATPFVSHFVGETNLLPASLFGGGQGDLHVRPNEIAIVANALRQDIYATAEVHIVNRFRKGPLWRIEGRLAASDRLIEIDCAPGVAVPA
ncbi:MAG: sulfate ABC transporter ATP-binding protein, partial [Pseudomonadota bacterium]|nr:sulfate ABC transporter ATP-binding protein [Pseudomonadota bacterium]